MKIPDARADKPKNSCLAVTVADCAACCSSARSKLIAWVWVCARAPPLTTALPLCLPPFLFISLSLSLFAHSANLLVVDKSSAPSLSLSTSLLVANSCKYTVICMAITFTTWPSLIRITHTPRVA